MNKRIFYVFLTLLLIASCTDYTKFVKVEINDNTYKFEFANTSELRKKGLMDRTELAKNGGMLFVYPEKRILGFYMKNTYIPLDIAFINEKYEIIDIFPMQPLDETSIVSSAEAKFALEVNRGFFERHKIKVGNKIKLLTAVPFSTE